MGSQARATFEKVVRHCGGRLEVDRLPDPYRDIVRDSLEGGYQLYERMQKISIHATPLAPVHIDVFDSTAPTAFCTKRDGINIVAISGGLIEQIYGTFLGLLAHRYIRLEVGDHGLEDDYKIDCPQGFPPLPICERSSRPVPGRVWRVPNDETRTNYAMILAYMALDFVVAHELGHLFGGHLEFLESIGLIPFISETDRLDQASIQSNLMHLLEFDADGSACDVAATLYLSPKQGSLLQSDFGMSKHSHVEIATETWAFSIDVLFRILGGDSDPDAVRLTGSHPHPVVRTALLPYHCNVSKAASDSEAAVLLDSFQQAFREIDDFWDKHKLPGRRIGDRTRWVSELQHAALHLGNEWHRRRTEIRRFAKVITAPTSGTKGPL